MASSAQVSMGWPERGVPASAALAAAAAASVVLAEAAAMDSRLSASGSISAGMRARAWLSAPCRSEEHTSELQSLTNLVCRLLLEKKKHTCFSVLTKQRPV